MLRHVNRYTQKEKRDIYRESEPFRSPHLLGVEGALLHECSCALRLRCTLQILTIGNGEIYNNC